MLLLDTVFFMLHLTWIFLSLGTLIILPGYCLSKVMYPKNRLSFLERSAFSIALSVTAVPLTVLFLNYFLNIKISVESIIASLLLIILPSIGIYFLEMHILRRMEESGKRQKRILTGLGE
ncbi:MAG: DUF1616 domain-containing protein [Candidatus Altiarchaeota archaeon]